MRKHINSCISILLSGSLMVASIPLDAVSSSLLTPPGETELTSVHLNAQNSSNEILMRYSNSKEECINNLCIMVPFLLPSLISNWGSILTNMMYGIKISLTLFLPAAYITAIGLLLFRRIFKHAGSLLYNPNITHYEIINDGIAMPIIEEGFFRGIVFSGNMYLFQYLLPVDILLFGIPFNVMLAIIINASLFTLLHKKSYMNILTWILGALLTFIYWETSSIIVPMTVHMIINLTYALITTPLLHYINRNNKYDFLEEITTLDDAKPPDVNRFSHNTNVMQST